MGAFFVALLLFAVDWTVAALATRFVLGFESDSGVGETVFFVLLASFIVAETLFLEWLNLKGVPR